MMHKIKFAISSTLLVGLFNPCVFAAEAKINEVDHQTQSQSNVFYRTYNMQDVLNSQDPRIVNPVREPIKEFMNSALTSVANDAAYHNEMTKVSTDINDRDEDQQLRWLAGSFEEKSTSQKRTRQVGQGISTSGSNFGKRALANGLGVSGYLNTGVKFELDLSNPLPFSEPAATLNRDNVTYGLIVEEINPSKKKLLTADSDRAFPASALKRAPKALVKYRIGPRSSTTDKVPGSQVSLGERGHQGFMYPSTRFKGSISPKSPGIAVAESHSGQAAIPPMITTISQEDQLYRLEYHTKEDFQQDSIHHGIALPVMGTMTMDREMDEDFKPLKTSAKKILIRQDAPALDLHYLNQEQAYQGDLQIQKNSMNINLKAQSASPLNDAGPKYEIGFAKNF